ncbi:MAG: hypothetical protein CMJ42_03310 [Phyllobacteriaceae bacterium]|nr:hypothetical protein [Phyllobacteriaceae bacterium]MBA92777.1 hypothetical protein [Phyllobacteriaceae bacterium]
MEKTPTLELPLIQPSQAQKHVTHNEALMRLDAVVNLRLEALAATEPPSSPQDGQCWAIGTGASGPWTGRDGQVAVRTAGAWDFVEPLRGWLAHDVTGDRTVAFDEGEWRPHRGELPDEGYFGTSLGIGAQADGDNRLAVAGKASLFTHSGDDHRLVINRADLGDTASVVFQTGFAGGAEIGLAGSGNLALKVADTAGNWADALVAEPDGLVTLPARPLARATLGGGWRDIADSTLAGFNTLFQSNGGVSLGSAITNGEGRWLTVPHAGFYLIRLNIFASNFFRVNLVRNDSRDLLGFMISDGSAQRSYSANAVFMTDLAAGDRLALEFIGSARCVFLKDYTELSLVRL